MPMTSDKLRTFIDDEITKWVRLARDAMIEPE